MLIQKYRIVFVLGMVLLSSSGYVSAETGEGGLDVFSAQEALFKEQTSRLKKAFADQEKSLGAEWDRIVAEDEAKWKKVEAEVLQKWDGFYRSSNKVWVDYSGDRESVSRVDFEAGKVAVEVLVPEGASPDEAKAAVLKKVQQLEGSKSPDGEKVLEGMLPGQAQQSIKKGDIPVEEVAKVTGRDGVSRRKVRVSLAMVSGHLRRRAERYLPYVLSESEKQGVDPALTLAIIHTESAFNPMARSHIPAFGLMQIVPRYAGKEAFQSLYGRSVLPTSDYLYDPQNNIKLGITYLRLLKENYFAGIEGLAKKRYTVVCAYNCGPTAMRKRHLKDLDVNTMEEKVYFESLLARVPGETRSYLKKVEERIPLYQR